MKIEYIFELLNGKILKLYIEEFLNYGTFLKIVEKYWQRFFQLKTMLQEFTILRFDGTLVIDEYYKNKLETGSKLGF